MWTVALAGPQKTRRLPPIVFTPGVHPVGRAPAVVASARVANMVQDDATTATTPRREEVGGSIDAFRFVCLHGTGGELLSASPAGTNRAHPEERNRRSPRATR